MPRREFSRKVRQAAIERAAGRCENATCRAALKPGEAEVDHILPDILGGEPTLANAQVLCGVCHKAKTADDIARTRKADRQRDRASGAIRPKGTIPQRPKPAKPEPKPMPVRKLDVYRRPVSLGSRGALWTGSNEIEGD